MKFMILAILKFPTNEIFDDNYYVYITLLTEGDTEVVVTPKQW